MFCKIKIGTVLSREILGCLLRRQLSNLCRTSHRLCLVQGHYDDSRSFQSCVTNRFLCKSWKQLQMLDHSLHLTKPFNKANLSTDSHHITETLTDLEYEQIADETLDSLTEKFEDLADMNLVSSEYDASYSSGVLTVQMGGNHGVYVINKQSPNKQIWLSSPVSGPKRYDFVSGQWIYRHDGKSLHSLLTTEVSAMVKQEFDFRNCSFGNELQEKTN